MLELSALVSGLGLGSMYGLMALGFYVTYAVSGTVNFAQGSSMMLGAVLTFTFAQTFGWPGWAAVILALALCALYGLLVEVLAVRPFVNRGSDAWLMATVAMVLRPRFPLMETVSPSNIPRCSMALSVMPTTE